MLYLRLRAPLTLDKIPKNNINIANQRNHHKIAVIDNDPFEYANRLKNHNFFIQELGDIQDIAAVSEYPILVCDIKDVGKHFGSAFEGAHVIKEIRKRYPDKYIIAFSHSLLGAEFHKFLDACDILINRDSDSTQWVDILDKAIKVVSDPIERWRRLRLVLINSEIPLFEIYLLEQAYIKSILKKDEKILENAFNRPQKTKAAKELIENLSAGLIAFIKIIAAIG